MKKILIVIFTFYLVVPVVFTQQKKNVDFLKISTPLTIDGILNEPAYQQAKPAKDFVQLMPYNGKPSFQPTEVYFFYDQTAVYVGAMLYDSAPDSIYNYLTERDNTGMSDYFGVYIDPYQQGQLAYGFFITPAGVQVDIKATKNTDGDSEDSNWNAVWESKTKITDKGWVVEMRIPYSALRFSEKAGKIWGLNMFRNIRRFNSNNSWNFIDRNASGFIDQQGQLSGITNVKPPVRLSLSPYFATYLETKTGTRTPNFLYKGGLDLKYGINESFTLDMMVIPDFGQIQSDDKQLNLSPYELYYDEKRQFFTEGTELFQRGGIFYSRRIGATPKFTAFASESLADKETVTYNPTETQLINASKISGRTKDGWGLGMLNAMSLNSYAELENTLTGDKRKVMVQPFTNYNVSVVDKSLKNNSFVSVINSNVSMANSSFMANVTATEFELRDRTKTYALKGKGGVSRRGENTYESGYYGYLQFLKNKGSFQYGIAQSVYSDKYNPNDLGYLQKNNYLMTEAYVYYQHIEPFWKIRDYSGNIYWNLNRVYNPFTLSDNEWGYNGNVNFLNNYYFNVNGGIATNKYDYYEPRVAGRYFFTPYNYWTNFNLNTDSRKKLSFYFHYGFSRQPSTDQYSNFGDASADFRIGQRFQISYSVSFNNTTNGVGFVAKNEVTDSIVFAKRNVNVFENVLSFSYALSNKACVTLRARHYWTGDKNKNYYLLLQDGNLQNFSSYSENHDQNYNAFTVDMLFRWIFAPGSELVCSWKNAANAFQNDVVYNYWTNVRNTWLNQSNTLSVKVLYYIDYSSIFKTKIR